MFEQDESRVRSFYAGQSVLVTGGTGFLGKLLIEKILRTCPDVSYVHTLARSRRDEGAHRRLENMLKETVFDRLRQDVPGYREKIRIIPGDCSLPALGLAADDAELLAREVSIVFNVAATVRFNENLKKAIEVNVGGTKELMELCKRMTNLKVVIHVSTAYSNCNRQAIDEVFYPPPMSAEDALDLARSMIEEQSSGRFEARVLGQFPNTYVYTKCIAEHLARRYGKELPVGVFRPAIVISTYREPVEGWIDNVYGPTGALAAAGIGLLRTTNMDESCVAELVPADYTVNALIVAAWAVGTERFRNSIPSCEEPAIDPPVYNYHSSWDRGITWGRYMDLAVKHGRQVPSVRSVWCYTFTAVKSSLGYLVLSLFLHLLPALLVDATLCVAGKKPRVLKMYKKLHKFAAVTSYFATRDWKFSNANTKRLWECLGPVDRELFRFTMEQFDWDDYMHRCIRGLRLYIFKDDPSTIGLAKSRMARFVLLHTCLKYGSLSLLLWLLYRAACAVVYRTPLNFSPHVA